MLTRSLPSELDLKSNGWVHTTRALIGGGVNLNVGRHAPSLVISAFTPISLETDCPLSTTAVSSTNGNIGIKEDRNGNTAVFTVQSLRIVILPDIRHRKLDHSIAGPGFSAIRNSTSIEWTNRPRIREFAPHQPSAIAGPRFVHRKKQRVRKTRVLHTYSGTAFVAFLPQWCVP